MTDISHRYLSA